MTLGQLGRKISLVLLAIIIPAVFASSQAQVLDVRELSVRDIQNLDREKTVVVLRGGILEQHGPYLPAFTDGYLNLHYAERVAKALVAERGLAVLMFPMIPLGAGLPEDFGGKAPFSGSYTVRPDTLRAVYMDLASAIGEDGFRTLFVLNQHGAPTHNRALLDAAEYFNHRFDGRMVILTSLLYEGSIERPQLFDEEDAKEDGFAVHAGAEESGWPMYLKPGLVHDDIDTAPPFTPVTPNDLSKLAEQPDWPGYFGSPRLATTETGKRSVEYRTARFVELALRIVDGYDWREVPTRADLETLPSDFTVLDNNTNRRASEERERQSNWLKAHGSGGN